jgi:hypothetical protein
VTGRARTWSLVHPEDEPMTLSELNAIHRQRPFRPFTVHLSDGMHYDIPTPEFLSYKPDSTALVVWELQRPGFAVISLPSIVRVTYPEPADSPTAPPGA